MANPEVSERLREALDSAVELPRGCVNPKVLSERMGRFGNRAIGSLRLVKLWDAHAKANRWRMEALDAAEGPSAA
jgi:hypothetical protein